VRKRRLRLHDPEDGFELVVFGLPISMVPLVAPDLVEQSPRWQAAVEQLQTVATQAMQLWLTEPAEALCGAPSGVVVGGFVEPYDTWADMSQLVPQEAVGSATVAYFCNAFAESGPAPPRGEADGWLAEQTALVRAHALRFLERDVAALWPLAAEPLTRAFNWDLLVAPGDATGPDRLRSQYLRANVEPSERYVLSVPGTSAARLPPDDTGYGNLYAVGDWTACVLNAGCVEAAVISGMVAANAIHRTYGDPARVEQIIGTDENGGSG
jgi:uncharacterized protein with NAD-binding domain and iron-sulfur cluster